MSLGLPDEAWQLAGLGSALPYGLKLQGESRGLDLSTYFVALLRGALTSREARGQDWKLKLLSGALLQ